MGASEASAAVKAIEFSGLAGTTDGYANNNDAATTAPTSGNIITANANGLPIGSYRGGTISNPETGWTIPAAGTLMEYLVVSSPGTYAATWTTTSSSYVANIAAFKVSARAPVVPTVTTPPVGLLSNISADLLGFISADGGATITEIGFQLGIDHRLRKYKRRCWCIEGEPAILGVLDLILLENCVALALQADGWYLAATSFSPSQTQCRNSGGSHRNKRTVWTGETQPYGEAYFATLSRRSDQAVSPGRHSQRSIRSGGVVRREEKRWNLDARRS